MKLLAVLLFVLSACGEEDHPSIFGEYTANQTVTEDTCNQNPSTEAKYKDVWVVSEAEKPSFHKYYLFERDRMGWKLASNDTKTWGASYNNPAISFDITATLDFHEGKTMSGTLIFDADISTYSVDGAGYDTFKCVIKLSVKGER